MRLFTTPAPQPLPQEARHFKEQAGGVARPRFAVDYTIQGVQSVLADTGQFQPQAVEYNGMAAAVVQPHRVARGSPVQVMSRGVSVFQQRCVVIAVPANPLTMGCRICPLPQCQLQVSHRLYRLWTAIDSGQRARQRQQMAMSVYKSGEQGQTAAIDHLGFR